MQKHKVLVAAFKRAKATKKVIKDLSSNGILDSEDTIKAEAQLRAEAKAQAMGGKPIQYLPGQIWYLNHLKELSSLSDQELLKQFYEELEPAFMSEEEMLDALKSV